MYGWLAKAMRKFCYITTPTPLQRRVDTFHSPRNHPFLFFPQNLLRPTTSALYSILEEGLMLEMAKQWFFSCGVLPYAAKQDAAI